MCVCMCILWKPPSSICTPMIYSFWCSVVTRLPMLLYLYTFCLCSVFNIFLYNIGLWNARCFLCHVVHCAPRNHIINILGMMDGHCTCNMVTGHMMLFRTLPQATAQ
jgi:hypothetical protein